MTAIYAIILFVLLIFPHELGHFLVAKAAGVKVNEFAFGMGPAIFQRQKGETLYSIRIIPIGGYCAMEGEDEESEDERAFNNKSPLAKIAILFAGAAMNILIAIVVLVLLMGIYGSPTTTVSQVEKGSPAYEAGLKAGDEIKTIDGNEIEKWNDISLYISQDGSKHTVVYERDGEDKTVAIKPEKSKENDGLYKIGIAPEISHNPVTAVGNGLKATWNMTLLMFESFRMLFSGQASVNDMAGPVGIITMAGDTAKYGFVYFAQLISLMSLNLAFINLLPLPALDGGRILFVIVRKLAGGRITDESEGKVHALGMALLLCLMLFVTWNDIVRLFS